MSFSHLLARAPYYSPAKAGKSGGHAGSAAAVTPSQLDTDGQGVTITRPQPAPLSSLLQAHRLPGRPLINPYEAFSADDFDAFVDDISSRIQSTLSYDARREASRKGRGYLDDEEYWNEMGGRPGEFAFAQVATEEAEQVQHAIRDHPSIPDGSGVERLPAGHTAQHESKSTAYVP